MPLDIIYLTRHGHRLNWTIDHKTGTYASQFPTPSGNPSDPTLTSHGVRQSHELAAHFLSDKINPKPFRVYSSPFYRCVQTILPTVEALKNASSSSSSLSSAGVDKHAEFDIRIENGVGEWFGKTTTFHHPTPPTLPILTPHFTPDLHLPRATPHLYTSTQGETIAQLHDRLATALAAIIAEVDAEIADVEAAQPAHEPRTSKAVLICSHAAPLIAIGRALTGRMPEDSSEEDFNVFTAGLSTFRRRGERVLTGSEGGGAVLAPGTRIVDPGRTKVPDWKGGKGVGGGWDCVRNGDCSFLSGGAERGWHFNGEEGFDTGPMNDGPLGAVVSTKL